MSVWECPRCSRLVVGGQSCVCGAKEHEPATITVPAPTPDEDGVYRPIAQAEVSTRRRVVVLDLGRPFHLRPDKAEALGAALLAAARDARRPSPMASERRKTNPHPGDYTP